MSTLNIILICASIYSVIVGCSVNKTVLDRIDPVHELASDSCMSRSKEYFQRFGYNVSNYFDFTFVKTKDLNYDDVADSIAILLPLEAIPGFENCYKTINGVPENRILLINLMDKNNKIFRKFIYNSVVSNDFLYPAKIGSEGIDISSSYSGFMLFQDYGQGCYAQYYIHIRYSDVLNDFVIDSLVYKDFCPGANQPERVRHHQFSKTPLPLNEYHRDTLISFKREFGIVD